MIIAALFITGCAGNVSKKVIVTVNDEPIYDSDLVKRLDLLGFIYQIEIDRDMYGEEILEQLIEERLLMQEVAKNNVQVEQEAIDQQNEEFIMMLVASYGGKDRMDEELKKAGLKVADFEELITDLTTISALIDKVTEGITVDDSDVRQYFDDNPDEFVTPESVRASHILVQDEDLAELILEKIENGEDFEDLAKEYSIDAANKEMGGDLGFFTYGDMVIEFEEAAFALDIDEISGIVPTQFGFHIIKVTDYVSEKMLTYEEAEDFVRQRLINWAQEDYFMDYIDELWDAAEVVRS